MLLPGRRELKDMTRASLVALLEIDPPADTMIPAIQINTETVEDQHVVRDEDQFPIQGPTTAHLHRIEIVLGAAILEIFLPANLQEAQRN